MSQINFYIELNETVKVYFILFILESNFRGSPSKHYFIIISLEG